MKTTCRCGAEWTGLRMEHCTVCHLTFSGTTAGDKHRVGDHAVFVGPDRRRCLTVEEMWAKGMTQNKRGVWTNGGEWPTEAFTAVQETPNRIGVGNGATASLEGARNRDHETRWDKENAK